MAATLKHYSERTGLMESCDAQPGKCPLKDRDDNPTFHAVMDEKEAQAYVENLNEQRYGTAHLDVYTKSRKDQEARSERIHAEAGQWKVSKNFWTYNGINSFHDVPGTDKTIAILSTKKRKSGKLYRVAVVKDHKTVTVIEDHISDLKSAKEYANAEWSKLKKLSPSEMREYDKTMYAKKNEQAAERREFNQHEREFKARYKEDMKRIDEYMERETSKRQKMMAEWTAQYGQQKALEMMAEYNRQEREKEWEERRAEQQSQK